jgi:hypothetical protein
MTKIREPFRDLPPEANHEHLSSSSKPRLRERPIGLKSIENNVYSPFTERCYNLPLTQYPYVNTTRKLREHAHGFRSFFNHASRLTRETSNPADLHTR